MQQPKTIIIGNWKMNKTNKDSLEFLASFKKILNNDSITLRKNLIYGVAPTATNFQIFKDQKVNDLVLVSQNCHFATNGAYTGELSTAMLKDFNIKYAIIGHSERRQYFNETNKTVNAKIKTLISNNMIPILCVGETLSQFENKETNAVVEKQLQEGLIGINNDDIKNIIVAYEPIWAIGTGKTATPEIAEKVCAKIRQILATISTSEIAAGISIQYGGSVKPNNVNDILKQQNINGALVGGASLDPQSFLELIIEPKE